MEFPLAGDQGEEGEGDVFGGEDLAEEFAVGGGVEGEGGMGSDDMDVVEVPGAGMARAADGSVLLHLLANGAEFLDGNHGGGIDEDRERIHFGHAAGRSVFVFPEIDREGFELIGANDGCLAAQLLEVGVEELVAGLVYQLEFEPVATPPGEWGVVLAGGFRRKVDVEGDEAKGGEAIGKGSFHAGLDVGDVFEVAGEGEVEVERAARAEAVDQGHSVAAFEDELVVKGVIAEEGRNRQATDLLKGHRRWL